jgi:hypothetical protein
VWRLNPRSCLHYRHWGHEWVVFDVGSGQTHEMDTVSAAALMQFEGGWLSLSDVCRGVQSDLELPAQTDLGATLGPLFGQFCELGLLEHRPA